MKEALKRALEALEAMQMYAAAEHKGLLIICDEAITAIKEALAQPAQAPEIHSRWQETIAGIPVIFESESEANRFMEYHLANAGKPMEQPPQRTWVGLTDEEIQVVAKQARSKDHSVTLTNKLLKEKNT